MKLIIDITEELYKDIQSRDWKNGELVFSDEWKAIHNGIPLDKIRAEIKSKIVKRPWLDFEDMERDRNDAFLEVLDIIDKYSTENEV